MNRKVTAGVAVLPLLCGMVLSGTAQGAEPVSIDGATWLDENDDGIRQESEGELWKGTAQVFREGEGMPVAEAMTGIGGRYSFTDLAPGRYYVKLQSRQPADQWPTLQDQGDDDTVDSDIDQVYWESDVLDCTGGHCATVDGGFVINHYGVAVTVDREDVQLEPGGTATVKGTVHNTGNMRWWENIYLTWDGGVAPEQPYGAGWHCQTGQDRHYNCSLEDPILPGQSRPVWFKVSAAEATSGTTKLYVIPNDDKPADDQAITTFTVG